MQSRTTLYLFILVVLVGGFIWFYERDADTTERRKELARRALRIDPDTITMLRIITDEIQVSCESKNGQWIITSPFKARADNRAIGRLLESLEFLGRGEVITSRERRRNNLTLDDYGLDRPRVKIMLGDDRQQRTICVGREAPLGGQLYIMEEGQRDVVVTSTNLLAALPRTATDLRDRRLFQGAPGDVTRMDIRRKEGFLQLSRSEIGAWRIQKPIIARAAARAVQDLLERIHDVQVADFVADSFAAAALYGLDEPAAQISLISEKKGGEQVLLLGKVVERAPDQLYATLQGSDAVYTVRRDVLDAINIRTEELRDRRLLTLPAHEIGYIHLQQDELSIKLRKKDSGEWEVIEPRQYKADDRRVQILLSDWTGARIEKFTDQFDTNLTVIGLSPPRGKITFARRQAPASAPAAVAAEPDATLRATLSAEEEENVLISTVSPGPGRLTVKRPREDALYEISDAVLDTFVLTPLYYRDHNVLAIDPSIVRRLTTQTDGIEQTVERDPTNVFRAVVTAAEVQAATVDEILDQLRRVNALDFVAEDPEDLVAYGLQPPVASLTIGLSGETAISKSILFGKDAGGNAVFAMVRGTDVVFTVEKGVRDNLLQPLYKVPPVADEKTVEIKPEEQPKP